MFIGEGESGCVVTPHIPCSIKTPKTVKTVGKIFGNVEEFNQEFRMIESIKRIDYKHKWSVKYYGECDIPKEHILKVLQDVYTIDDDRQHVCYNKVNAKSNQTYFKQIIYQNGGISLSEYLETKPREDFFTLIYELCEGVCVFALNGIFFNDIKTDNITYHRIKNKLLFIDFGAATYHNPNDDDTDAYAWAVRFNLMSLHGMLNNCLSNTQVREVNGYRTFIMFMKSLEKISKSKPHRSKMLDDMESVLFHVNSIST